MSGTNYIASNWRVPNQENSSKSDNYGLTFSGTSEYINCGGQSLFNGLTTFSVSCWIKTNGTQQDYASVFSYFSSATQYLKLAFYPLKKDRIRVQVRPGTTSPVYVESSPGSIVDGQWVHIVAVGDANNLSNLNVYINGVLDNNVTQGNITTLAQSSDIYIGTDADPPYITTREFQGNISEVAIFDYALSEPQISTLYGSSSLGSGNPMALKPTPVAYYPLGDNSASDPLTQPNVSVDDASVFEFDGTSQYVGIGTTSLGITSAITVSAWVKTTNILASYKVIACEDTSSSGNRNWLLVQNSSRKVQFIVWHTNGTFTSITRATIDEINDGNWHHVMATFDGTTNANGVKLYIDRNLESATAGSTGINSTASVEPYIGSLTNGNSWRFEGNISNVAIWDSVQNIDDIYNSGVPATSYTDTPVAWYKLDQSANWEADTAGNWQIPNAVSEFPQSFNFSPADEYFDTGNNPLIGASNLSISAWFNSADVDFQYLLGDNSVRFSIKQSNGDTRITFTGSVDPFRGFGVPYNVGEWNNIILTFDGSLVQADRLKLYHNGVPINNINAGTPSTTLLLNTAASFMIGRAGSTSLDTWNGKISNVQLWDVTLDQPEVTTLYNGGTPTLTPPNQSDLKGWWKLDDSAKSIYNNNGGFWTIEDGNITPTYTEGLFFGGGYIGGSPLVNYAGMRLTNQTISSGHVTNSFWWKLVKPTTGSSTAIVKTGGNLGEIKVTSSGVVQWVGDGAAKYINFGTNVGDGAWHHILVYYPNTTTIDHNDVRCFIDGSEATKTLIGGSSSTGPQTSIEGILQQSVPLNVIVSNWSYWLSDQTSNIDAIYNNGTPGDISSLSPDVWLKFDNATTSFNGVSGAEYGLATDSSGNSNDGDLSGKTSGTDVRLDTSNVQSNSGVSSGMTEQSLVNNNVSTLNGESSGMTSGNLVLSDLTRNLPYENYSLDFDSASPDYIGASPTSISSTITVSAWIKTSTTGIQTIVNEDQAGGAGTRNWNLLLEPGNKIQIVIVNTDGTVNNKLRSTALEVQDGNWHHIVFTYDGTANVDGLKTYVDGGNLESFQTTSTGIITTDTLGVYIGSLQVTGAWPFSGNICNVSIFNEALTSTEVQKLYANGIPQDLTNFTPQPLHWWTLGKESFWNGSDWIVRDMIGSNDGTSANMAVNDLVGDAPRSEANGTGTNMDIPTNLVGNAGFSDKNAYSINMSPSARVTDTP